jgi:ADP-heptose:LPS heptosyltransferase
MRIYLEAVAKLRFSRFSGIFEPIFDSFLGGNINLRILPPKKESKIGQKASEKRRTLSFATTSKNYFVGSKAKRLLLVLEPLYRFFALFKKKKKKIFPPRRILLCNWASLGDLVLATSVIKPLKKAFPNAELGFLAADWTQEIIERHPDIRWVHKVENWHNKRTGKPLWKRIGAYLKSTRNARKEINAIHYDAAIDLHPFFFNSISFLHSCSIPERIGFDTAGFSSLLTKAIPWNAQGHLGNFHRLLLKSLHIDPTEELSPSLGSIPELPSAALTKCIPASLLEKEYLLLHMGTGETTKEWKEDYWRELAIALVKQGHTLLFTGKGPKEKKRIAYVTRGLEHCYDLCDQKWEDLLFLIKHCHTLISLDSVTIHVAGSFKKRCIILFLGTPIPSLWNPSHAGCMALIQKKGEEITPPAILKAFDEHKTVSVHPYL